MKDFIRDTDLRIKKTKDGILCAATCLLSEKPISKITVNDICDLAKISRKTFYNHYMDIYDLVDQICESIAEHFWNNMFDNDTLSLHKIDIYHFCHEALVQNGQLADDPYPTPQNNTYMVNRVSEFLHQKLTAKAQANPDYNLKTHCHIFYFISCGIIGSYQKWYETDRSVPLKVIADELSDFINSRD